MIVDVELDAPAASAISIHADAVIDSGTAQRVFVALGGGHYELRDVETGWQNGDRVEIRRGLQAGRAHRDRRRLPARFGKPHEES